VNSSWVQTISAPPFAASAIFLHRAGAVFLRGTVIAKLEKGQAHNGLVYHFVQRILDDSFRRHEILRGGMMTRTTDSSMMVSRAIHAGVGKGGDRRIAQTKAGC